jgi:hypothetical protein
MSKPIGFSAFLKLLELSDGARTSELRKKLVGGGGFQYWRPLQIVAPKALLPAANIEFLKRDIDALCSGHQRQYNQQAFATFCKWISGKSVEPCVALPALDVPFGNSGLTIRLKPDVSFKLDGSLVSMNLWATTKPILSTPTLSVALFFAASAYNAQSLKSHKHVILDTITTRFFQEDAILPTAIHLLKNKVDAFKKSWDSLNPTPPASPDAPLGDQPTMPK